MAHIMEIYSLMSTNRLLYTEKRTRLVVWKSIDRLIYRGHEYIWKGSKCGGRCHLILSKLREKASYYSKSVQRCLALWRCIIVSYCGCQQINCFILQKSIHRYGTTTLWRWIRLIVRKTIDRLMEMDTYKIFHSMEVDSI